MPVGKNTQPELITDKNGKATTVHKGRTAKTASGSQRIASVAPTRAAGAVQKDDEFYMHIADGSVKFTVTKVSGNVVTAVSDSNDPDYPDMQRDFLKADVAASMSMTDFWSELGAKYDSFWESRTEGEIIHYHNGFGEFVRGEIVKDGDEVKMRPIGLIGAWRNPVTRGPDGELHYGYHADKVINGVPFKPSASTVWEYMRDEDKLDSKYDFIRKAGGDINSVEPISLELPPITDKEVASAAVYEIEGDLYDTVSNGNLDLDNIGKARALLDNLEKAIAHRDSL